MIDHDVDRRHDDSMSHVSDVCHSHYRIQYTVHYWFTTYYRELLVTCWGWHSRLCGTELSGLAEATEPYLHVTEYLYPLPHSLFPTATPPTRTRVRHGADESTSSIRLSGSTHLRVRNDPHLVRASVRTARSHSPGAHRPHPRARCPFLVHPSSASKMSKTDRASPAALRARAAPSDALAWPSCMPVLLRAPRRAPHAPVPAPPFLALPALPAHGDTLNGGSKQLKCLNFHVAAQNYPPEVSHPFLRRLSALDVVLKPGAPLR